jgi:hypothetical protein
MNIPSSLHGSGAQIDRRRHLACVVALALLVGALSSISAHAATTYTLCDAAYSTSPTVAQADALLANKYKLGSFPTATLPSTLTWKENPFKNDSWVLAFHQLAWTEPLWYAYVQTGQIKYFNRYYTLLRGWLYGNPQNNPPSPWSWAAHAVAIRSMVVACALTRFSAPWLRVMGDAHGAKLADPNFYLQVGNRALDQDIGLLDVGCVRSNSAWRSTALSRMNTWAATQVDSQGVTGEQSDGYNLYVYRRLDLASQRLAACGLSSSSVTSQDQAMVAFIAQAETPSGYTIDFGDTSETHIPYDFNNRASILNWMYTNGSGGTMPSLPLYATFSRGYAFFRSSWGTAGTVNQQTHIMVRFGEGRSGHGHEDAGEVTLEAFGGKLLLDSGGPYVYNDSDPYRRYFVSERADNTMSIDGNPMIGKYWTYLKGQAHDANMDFVATYHTKFVGVTTWRRVLFDRRLNIMLVDDSLGASGTSVFRQTWHLRPDANPGFNGRYKFATRSTTGPNVSVIQLDGGKFPELHVGATNPIQGWLVRPPVEGCGSRCGSQSRRKERALCDAHRPVAGGFHAESICVEPADLPHGVLVGSDDRWDDRSDRRRFDDGFGYTAVVDPVSANSRVQRPAEPTAGVLPLLSVAMD